MLQRWVHLLPYHVPQRIYPQKLVVHTVLEPPEVPDDPGCNHLDLRSRQKGCLRHFLEKGSRGPGVSLLPPQNPGEPHQLYPGLSHIINHHHQVIFGHGQEPSQILQGGHRLQRPPIGLNAASMLVGASSSTLRPALPLYTLGSHHCSHISPVKCLP